jgi:hypothetical protein
MTDDTMQTTPDPELGDEAFGFGEPEVETTSRSAQAREWLTQLQAMIEQVAEQAGPVMRDIAMKAAELAAVAGEKAGPVAHRAAEMTESAGLRLAERSRDLAEELRRDQAKETEAEAEEPIGTAPGA